MKRETINATMREINEVIRQRREIAQAEIKLAENEINKAHWEGYDMGLSKAYWAICTHLEQFID